MSVNILCGKLSVWLYDTYLKSINLHYCYNIINTIDETQNLLKTTLFLTRLSSSTFPRIFIQIETKVNVLLFMSKESFNWKCVWNVNQCKSEFFYVESVLSSSDYRSDLPYRLLRLLYIISLCCDENTIKGDYYNYWLFQNIIKVAARIRYNTTSTKYITSNDLMNPSQNYLKFGSNWR